MTDGATLDRLWDRQGKRLALATRWWALCGGRPGAHVADVGCGSGRLSLAYAEWAGPAGAVLAVDTDPDALAYLDARRDPARHANVETILLDVAESPLPARRYDAVLVTMVLHHVERPVELLRHLRPTRSTLLVAEFHPEGAGEMGPPPAMRVAPETVAAWLREAGWDPQAPALFPRHESYAIVCAPTPPMGHARPADEA